MDKLRIIDGEYDDWVSLKDIEQDAEIAARVETLYCDTRDFALGWNFKPVEPYEKAECGLEHRTNEGLKQIEKMKRNGQIADCLIEPHEILPWLNELCQKSGGYDEDWRFLTSDVEGCHDWDIKYIRFVHQPDGRFIACNGYFWPIHWREVIDNIKTERDYEEEERKFERFTEQAAPLFLHNPYANLYDPPKPRPVYWDGPCCGRCKNRFNGKSDWCFNHYKQDRCYRFKLDK